MKFYIIPVVLLGSCATVNAKLPEISENSLKQEQLIQEQAAFAGMAALRDRLIRVSAPILQKNADLCDKIRPDIGALTHTLKSYPKDLREAAAREVNAQDHPTILYIRPDSPADKAGLRVGDRLQNKKGDDISLPGKRADAVFKDTLSLQRIRGDDVSPITYAPDLQCGYNVKLRMSSVINAYATGKSIIVTSGMMNFVKSDEELALIVGHELAHNTAGHVRKIVTNLVLSGFATRYTRPFEAEADYIGMYYMARAGYELDNVEDIWRRLSELSPKGIHRAKTHPKYPSRYLSLAATREEINAKRRAGQALTPNMKEAS